MKNIDYIVQCDSTKLKRILSKNKDIVNKRFSEIIKKRRELSCYEVIRNKNVNISKEK